MINKRDKMNCSEYIEYLKSNKLDFTERRDWNPNGQNFIHIIPKNKRYKERVFVETMVTRQVNSKTKK